MNHCKYCGKLAPYILKKEDREVYVCDDCFTKRKNKFKKEGLKLVYSNLNELK